MIENKRPEHSDWVCYPFGKQDSYNLIYRPMKGQEPNAFHRFMQKACFGIHWEKQKNDKDSEAGKGSNGV